MRCLPMTPEAAEAYAATLPPYALPTVSSTSWLRTRISLLGLSIHLPSGFSEHPDAGLSELGFQVFLSADGAELYLQQIDNRGGTANFILMPEDSQPSMEGQFALRIADRLTAVTLVHHQLPSRVLHAATATVVLEGDRCIGVGILAPTAEQRAELLHAVHSLGPSPEA